MEYFRISSEDGKYNSYYPNGMIRQYSHEDAINAATYCILNKVKYTITLVIETPIIISEEEIIKRLGV